MHRTPAAALVACLALSACTTAPAPGEPTAATAPPTSGAATQGAAADPVTRTFEHLAALQSAADANGGNRAHGTPGYAASLDYVEGVLRAGGYDTTRDQREAIQGRGGEAELRIVQGQQVDIGSAMPMVGSSSTAAGGVTAPLTVTEDRQGCAASDYARAKATVVLVERGRCRFADKARLATEAGALALVVHNASGQGELGGDLGDGRDFVPTVGIAGDAGGRLRQLVEGQGVVVGLSVRSEHDVIQVTNLIAQWPGDPERVVMLGAHLDSVPAGAGINDNASGVALSLALAERLAAEDAAEGLRIGFWDAEEMGLIGSGAYVRAMSQEERERVASYVNLDMVASPNGLLGLYGEGDPLAAFESIAEGEGIDADLVDLNGSSDHMWFQSLGIGVVGIYTGAGENLTDEEAERYGGDGDRPRDPCYHQACDVTQGIDTPEVRERLGEIARLSEAGLRRLLEDR